MTTPSPVNRIGNYSFETSLPAYKSNQTDKRTQATKLMQCMTILEYSNIKELARLIGIPDAVCSARLNDLIKEGKLAYDGTLFFEGRKRKKIILVKQLV